MPAACISSLSALPVAQPGIVFQIKQIILFKKEREEEEEENVSLLPQLPVALFSLAFVTNVAVVTRSVRAAA